MQLLEIAPLPILAAPMAGGTTTPALLGAAAAAGSLGFLPAGYRTIAQLEADVAAARLATDSFGVNLFVPDPTPIDRAAVIAYRDLISPEVERLGAELGALRWEDDDEWHAKLDLLITDPAPWVSFTFGLPDADTVRRLRRAGSRLLFTVTSPGEARQAAELEPDGLVVQSADAGGHRGTFDQRCSPGHEALTDLVTRIRAATNLPVVAAGGVATRQQAVHVLGAGAEAVQVGTALLLADEAGTRPVHRRAIVAPDATTTTMRAFTGRVARGIRTGFSHRYDDQAPAAYPVIHHLTAPLRRWAAEHDDPDHLHLWAGTGHRRASPGPTAELLGTLVP